MEQDGDFPGGPQQDSFSRQSLPSRLSSGEGLCVAKVLTALPFQGKHLKHIHPTSVKSTGLRFAFVLGLPGWPPSRLESDIALWFVVL